MRNALRAVNRAALPWWPALFILLGLTWLWAPGLHHGGIERLHFISNYEAVGQPYGELFRASDWLAALLLLTVLVAGRLHRRSKALFGSLVVVAALMAVDAIFAVTCRMHGHGCIETASLSRAVHDAESLASARVLFVAVCVHAKQFRSYVSLLFVIFQLSFFAVVVFKLSDRHYWVSAMQFAYQSMSITWLAWVASAWMPKMRLTHARWWRRSFAVWTGLAGLLALLATGLRLPVYDPERDALFGAVPAISWLHPLAVLAGLLMLYLARHVWRGERVAAYVLLTLFALQSFRFSVLQPHQLALALYIVSFALLFTVRQAFDRNSTAFSMRRRLIDTATILGLAILSVVLLAGAASARAGKAGLSDILSHTAGQRAALAFAAGVALLVAWTMFRPARRLPLSSRLSLTEVEAALSRHALDSEDYAKRWPADKRYFERPGIDGFIAYRPVGGIAFALADPICRKYERRALLSAFKDYCRQNGWSACFLMVPESSLGLYEGFRSIAIGSSAFVEVALFAETTCRDKWWRWKLNGARKNGYVYESVEAPGSSRLLAEMRTVSEQWLTRPGHQEQGFALGGFDPAYLRRCRLHLLRDAKGRLVAFANEPPVFGDLARVTVDLIRFRPEADQAMPALLAGAIMHWHDEGRYTTFDLGFVPLAGVNSKLAGALRHAAKGRYSAGGLQQFKNKFKPDWRQNYLAFEGDVLDLATVAVNLERVLRPIDDQ